jgi:hypothetical protein
MCDYMHEEIKEKETVNAKAKAKDIEGFEVDCNQVKVTANIQ